MSFNRSGYIGRAPGDSSIVLAKQYFQPTGAGKTFTFTAGYDPGLIDVYRNGVKLVNVLDYAATDGSTIVLDTPVGVGTTVQVVAYKGFNLTEVNSSGADFNVGTNLYVQSGFGSFSQGITANQIDVSGIGTIGIGSFVDINVSGGATVNGTLVAGSFSGDGSSLTGVGQTLNVRTHSLTSSGIVTITDTTDSTSSSTGSLIISGGVGIAKNVYIGAGLSVAGTLTYEDVTNVDSVGMVTAKSGVNVSGGELNVGLGFSVGNVGVVTANGATFNGDVTFSGDNYNSFWDKSDNALKFTDNSKAIFGDHSGTGDLHIVANGTNSLIQNNTGYLGIQADTLYLQDKTDGHAYITCVNDGAVGLRYDNSQKFETTKFGTIITGVTTTSELYVGGASTIATQLNLGTNGSYFKENQLKFAPSGIAYIDHGTTGKNITFRMSNSSALDTNAIIVGATGITTFADTPHDDLGSLRDIPLRSVTGSAATLVVADAGKVVSTNTTGWTVPASTFSEGDTVTLLNNSAGDLTITCSAVTTYLTSDGSTVTSSTLGARGLATLYFVSSSVAYLQGTSLS